MKLRREQFERDFIAQLVSDIETVKESYLATLESEDDTEIFIDSRSLADCEIDQFVKWLRGREDD